jgi:hypothetical protein
MFMIAHIRQGTAFADWRPIARTCWILHESSDPSLVNFVFFDSSSRDQALEISRIHPGLHYGVTVEVRDWNPPRPLQVRE